MAKPLRVALIAGESSGDILGAGLMQGLKKQHPNIEFGGIGGELMIAEGMQSLVPMERLSVMGITEVLGRLRELFKVRDDYQAWCLNWQPDVFVGIDAPDFNLGLEVKLRKAGIKTVHYVSPSVWAWRKGRLKKIRKAVDHMLTLLPFEASFYQDSNIPVTFVGHTLADQLPVDADNAQQREYFGLAENDLVVAMLPGSRGNEVKTLAALFLQTLSAVSERVGEIKVLIPAANEKRYEQIKQIIAEQNLSLDVQVLLKQADESIAAADAVLVASGTATLQTMLWKKPMVVAYQMSAFSYWLISSLATTRWVALPNILEQRDWVPERLQEQATVSILAEDMVRALTDVEYRSDFKKLATKWHKALALGADEQAAKAVLSVINK